MVINYQEDANQGLAGLGAQDTSIPHLTILQSKSPQVEDQTVEGARAGSIFNTLSNEIYTTIKVINCAYKRDFVEWIPRIQGGGLVGVHQVDNLPEYKAKDGKLKTLDGNELVETASHFVLYLTEDGEVGGSAIISMTVSQLKKSRKWNSLMMGIRLTDDKGAKYTPARYSHIYTLGTVKETGKGHTFYGWTIDIDRAIDDPDTYEKARALSKMGQPAQISAPVTEDVLLPY